MRLRTVMHSIAGVAVLLILATPIARTYIHGGHPTATTGRQEEARFLPPSKGSASSAIPEPETFTIVSLSLGLLALGAAARQRRGLDARGSLARLQVVP